MTLADSVRPSPATELPSPPADGLTVTVVLHAPDATPPTQGWLEGHLEKIARRVKVNAGEICVAVVDDVEMARLHLRDRSEPGPTDVLTYDLTDRNDRDHAPDDEALRVSGDVVINIDEAERQAWRRRHDTRLEVLLYAVHGLLHLIGHDDASQDDAAAMHQTEDALLAWAGFGAVYASSATSQPDNPSRDD